MDIVVHGFDLKKLALLKEYCPEDTFVPANEPSQAQILISQDFFDPRSYVDFMRSSKGNRFILHADVSKNVLQAAASALKKSPGQSSQGFMPPALRDRYSESIYEKIAMLNDLAKNIDVENLKILRNEAHKIAGSAGSFGYPEMTTLSRNLEHALNTHLDGTAKIPDEKIPALLADYQNSLKLAFQNILPI